MVLVAGLSYAFAEATTEGLWLQVSALLVELGVLSGKSPPGHPKGRDSGRRRLLVLGDGASWIRTWFVTAVTDSGRRAWEFLPKR